MPSKGSCIKESKTTLTPSPRVVAKFPLGALNAEDLYAALASSAYGFIWETSDAVLQPDGSVRHVLGKESVVCLKPYRVLRFRGSTGTVFDGNGNIIEITSDLRDSFAWSGERLSAFNLPFSGPTNTEFSGEFGILGVVAYDAVRHLESLPCLPVSENEPDQCWIVPQWIACIDSQLQFFSLWTVFDEESEGLKVCIEAARELSQRSAKPRRNADRLSPPRLEPEVSPLFTSDAYQAQVRRAKEYIRNGDAYQIVLSNRFELNEKPDALAVSRTLKEENPSPYHFYVALDELTLVGASPEVFLRGNRVTEGEYRVHTRLVAGTYPLHTRIVDARAERDALRADPKERAEHVMLVDHMRNDIGKVSQIGSVRVKDFLSVERYRDVLHLVSEVEGILRKDESPLSALQACFPIATLTGTPKIRAMQIISELESEPRGLFGGAVCRLGFDASFDSTVTIRSLVVHERGAHIWAGAGIVADSNPEREYAECCYKAKSILDAVFRVGATPNLSEPQLAEQRAAL